MCTHPAARDAVPWDQARRLAYRLPTPLDAERVPLAAAAGRTLASAMHAAAPLPGFDNAAMDGYAVRGAGPWRLVGRLLAGEPGHRPLEPGEAVEIATGAMVPPRTERVIEYEITRRDGATVTGLPGQRRHIRQAGEYVAAGQPVLPAGAVLTAPAVGLAASVGLDEVTVTRAPAVWALVSGDEVVSAGPPPTGLVRDAIGPLVATLLPGWGARLVEQRHLPDHPAEALALALADSLSAADLTIVCGASSVGPADNLHDALASLDATVHIDGVRCRPGHPQVLASAGAHWLVGLPGNPFAALVAAFTVLQPLLAALLGRPLPVPPRAHLAGDPRPDPRNTRIVPVRWQHERVHLVDGAAPGYLGAAARADALAVIPPDWHPEQSVEILPLPGRG